MNQILWSPQARQDLKFIYMSIARVYKPTALRIVSAVKDKVSLLSRHPQIGVQRSDLSAGTRMLVAPPHLVFYMAEEGAGRVDVERKILRILDGRRDLKELL